MVIDKASPTATRIVLAIKLFFIFCSPTKISGHITLMGVVISNMGRRVNPAALSCAALIALHRPENRRFAAMRLKFQVLNSRTKPALGAFVGDIPVTRAVVRFGSFELDQDAGELRRDGTKVRLQEQPLQILQILLEQPGKVVAREELRKRIWPSDTFVDFDHGINNAIKRLREALGDTAETPRYIETLPRRGYRFIANLEPAKVTGPRMQSIAVLPLENLSRDPEQEYFADGMTEAL